MASRTSRVRLGIFTLSAIFLTGTANATILPSKLEQKCVKKLAKLSTKFAGTVAKETAACRNADINGSVVGACRTIDGSSPIRPRARSA